MVKKIPSQHFEKRIQPIQFIIVHCFALSVPQMIQTMDSLGVSVHYLIDEQGKIIQMVSDNQVAFHAGQSYWRGISGLNSYSIGIELQNMTLGQTPYSEKQLQTLKKLIQKLMKKYQIPSENILGHSDIAPIRKVDPGIAFPWQQLGLGPKDLGIKNLGKIGYDISNPVAAELAYNRHFHSELVPIENDILSMESDLSKFWTK